MAQPEPPSAVAARITRPVDPSPPARTYACDRCGTRMVEWQCKIICPNCGCRFDCSDLTIRLDELNIIDKML
jgi:hypothetical protein